MPTNSSDVPRLHCRYTCFNYGFLRVPPLPQKPLDGGSETSGVSVDFGPTLSDAKEEKAATFELKYLVREVDILTQLDHPTIVHMSEYFVSKSGSKIYIVLQYLGAAKRQEGVS